ncbi:hypothetical protein [Stutzerimonas kunmingensis]|uniref:hypothetical protein n=1 Tax=Stutzerimonas kunmingensis TaxID=1211807 RepID=UPI0028AF979E|nr:hypothetical protein [Stutzerimonas kunmingensis]
MSNPTVKITTPVESRTVTTSKGMPKTIYYQRAEVETEKMRVQLEVEVDGPDKGYPVGVTKEWDLIPDLVPGRFGIELARRMTLIDPLPGKQQTKQQAA